MGGGPAERRLVVQSPAIAEILFQIGAGAEVVAVSKHTTHPPEVAALPKIEVLPINLEALATLAPTDILCQNPSDRLRDFARASGVRLHELEIERLEDIRAATLRLGELTGREDAARAELARLDAAFEPARVTPASPRTALISLSREPGRLEQVFSTSRGFLTELVELCGARNAFDDLDAPYPQITLEAILDRDPDLIIEIPGRDVTAAEAQTLKADWARIEGLSAGAEGRVCVIGGADGLLPGPRVTELLARIRDAAQPQKVD